MAEESNKLIEEYLADNPNISEPIDVALSYAYLKGTDESITQVQFSKALGVSDRQLRKHISSFRAEYDEELERAKGEAEPDVDLNNISRTLTNEQLDLFIQSLIQSAIKPNASVKEKEQLIKFANLSGDDLLNLTAIKQRSLHWFIKNELGKISNYLDAKSLGIMIEESDKLNRDNKDSTDNTQTFVDADITDESFRLELMYWGAVFMSMYGETQHPDLELLAQAVRLDKIQQGKATPLNKRNVKPYAKGKDIKQEDKKPVSNEKLEKMYVELFGQDEADKMLSEINRAKDTVKAPEFNKADVEQRITEHQEELEVLLSVEDELRKMLRFNK